VGLEARTTKMLCLRHFKEFSSRSHLPTALKLLIAMEDDWIDAEDFVVKVCLWLRLLEIEEGNGDGHRR
jgi:hypothetical protein